MPSIYYKNLDDDVVRQGHLIQEDAEFLIPISERSYWANDPEVLSDIVNQRARIGDGTQYFSEIHDQLDHLRGVTEVRISEVEEGAVLPQKEVSFPERTGYNVYQKGYEFLADPAAPGGVTEHEASYNQWMKLQGVEFRVGSTAYEGSLESGDEGDYMEVEVVDPFGISGYPPGTVLAKFGETVRVWPERYFSRICPDAKELPPTIAIRFRYVARGTEKVRVKVEHILRTMPQP